MECAERAYWSARILRAGREHLARSFEMMERHLVRDGGWCKNSPAFQRGISR